MLKFSKKRNKSFKASIPGVALWLGLTILAVTLIGVWRRSAARPAAAEGPVLPYPVLFVTQVPIPADFTTIGSVFGNHRPSMQEVGRGGDLWIRYPDGALKNLTETAGYGTAGFQGDNSIAVREPSVHWDGTKAVFSMVIGAPTQQWQWETYYWQLYEITGLGQSETPVITKVANQPESYNNVSPLYGTDGRIIFTSDRPRNGAAHLYPQLDEYEEAPTVTGLWSLDPATGDLKLLNHAPSGDFTPIIDSHGRLVFTQWDHLQRDQQADTDALSGGGYGVYGTFNWSDESADSVALLDDRTEVFPEPRPDRTDLLQGTNLAGHTFNHFFPWTLNEDGTNGEVLAHLGRHELHSYFDRSLTDDPNLVEFIDDTSGRVNPNEILNLLQVKEDPLQPGLYYGVDAPEFYTHAAGQIISLNAPPEVNPDTIIINYLTHRDTASYTPDPSPDHSGHYRNPLPLSDGTLVAVHTAETDLDTNEGTREYPVSRYDFRLKTLGLSANGYWVADQPLTAGITKTIAYWDPDYLVHYSGVLWELDPVEVRPRPLPLPVPNELPAPEQQVFNDLGLDPAALQAFLTQYNLALVVSRNVTTRDDADHQQPFNLRIFGTNTQTIGAAGEIYDVAWLQFFQADQLRGLDWGNREGRRVLAQPLHENLPNPPNSSGVAGAVTLAEDGSMAAFVPAGRALTWQLVDNTGQGVVRERYWLTFQAGEIRVCTSCHGVNEFDQAGNPPAANEPEALRQLLQYWRTLARPCQGCSIQHRPPATP